MLAGVGWIILVAPPAYGKNLADATRLGYSPVLLPISEESNDSTPDYEIDHSAFSLHLKWLVLLSIVEFIGCSS